ncbi:MAG: ABC transporter ATP-binding protein [Faecalibacterium sp.]
MKQDILTLSHLCYAYDGDGSGNALQDLCFGIGKGEKIAILGNNGAGKSTLFLCCNGVLKAKQGNIALHGQTLDYKNKSLTKLRQAVSLVFQDADTQLLAGTVEAEVSFGPMNLNLPHIEVAQRVDTALTQMGLCEYRTRAPHYLSGGEKKRITLADALAMHPDIMLLDEPTASLDAAHSALLETHLDQLHQNGIALVIATHDLDFTWRWADRILLMHQGKLVADGSPEDIFADKNLLQTCGLCQPLLWQVGEALGIAPPRSIEELRTQ